MTEGELIDEMRRLLTDADAPSWGTWWEEHGDEVEEAAGSGWYKRLKFKKMDGAEQFLERKGVEIEQDEEARLRKLYAKWFQDEELDDSGRPKVEELKGLDWFGLDWSAEEARRETVANIVGYIEAEIERLSARPNPSIQEQTEVTAELAWQGWKLAIAGAEEGWPRREEGIRMALGVVRYCQEAFNDRHQSARRQALETLEECGVEPPSSGS